MHTLHTPNSPAMHIVVPMYEPCLLCLPLHSSCDPTTCPSLLLFGQESTERANTSLNSGYWIISTSLVALEESASNGCLVCATLYTGIMTDRSCHELKEVVQVKVARNGHVGLLNSDWMTWMTELSFYTTNDPGTKYIHALFSVASQLGLYSQDHR